MNKKLEDALYKSITPIVVIIVSIVSIFIAYKLASPYERCLRWYQKVPDWHIMESMYIAECAKDHKW